MAGLVGAKYHDNSVLPRELGTTTLPRLRGHLYSWIVEGHCTFHARKRRWPATRTLRGHQHWIVAGRRPLQSVQERCVRSVDRPSRFDPSWRSRVAEGHWTPGTVETTKPRGTRKVTGHVSAPPRRARVKRLPPASDEQPTFARAPNARVFESTAFGRRSLPSSLARGQIEDLTGPRCSG